MLLMFFEVFFIHFNTYISLVLFFPGYWRTRNWRTKLVKNQKVENGGLKYGGPIFMRWTIFSIGRQWRFRDL